MIVTDEELERMCKAHFEHKLSEDGWAWAQLPEHKRQARRKRMRAALGELASKPSSECLVACLRCVTLKRERDQARGMLARLLVACHWDFEGRGEWGYTLQEAIDHCRPRFTCLTEYLERIQAALAVVKPEAAKVAQTVAHLPTEAAPEPENKA